MNKIIGIIQKIICEEVLKNNKYIAYHGTTDKGYRSYDYTYYTTDFDYAKKYAESNGRVIKFEINLKNPFIINAKYMGYGEIVVDNKIIGFYRNLKKDAVEKLIKKGYDGIAVNYEGKIGFEIIPFYEHQVNEIESMRININEITWNVTLDNMLD